MRKVALLALLVLLVGCQTIGTEYKDANIRAVTDARLVEGMEFLDGHTSQYPDTYSIDDLAKVCANEYANLGWKDVTVLVERKGTARRSVAGFHIGDPTVIETIVAVSVWR